MSAVVASHQQPISSVSSKARTPLSSLTRDPMDSNKAVNHNITTAEDTSQKPSANNNPLNKRETPIIQEPTNASVTNSIITNAGTQPLAPPPKPSQSLQAPSSDRGSDHFAASQPTSNSHFSREPNPFERSFGQPSSEPGDTKSLLPPVAALTSPAPLPSEGALAGGYNFLNSLRSGPLSPAMLGGPVGSGTDYFDPALRGTTSFPGVTPNESSLRTGLTPGGGGSMFPVPSPGSQAFIQSLQSGGATPSTIDFHRTAATSAASNKPKSGLANGTNAPEPRSIPASVMDPSLQQATAQSTTFGEHDNDAANGLFLLAQATNPQHNNQFAAPVQTNMQSGPNRSAETSPQMHGGGRNRSLTESVQGAPEDQESGDNKPSTRTRGKRASAGKATNNNSRRKAESTPFKQPPSKRAKMGSDGPPMDMDDDSDEEQPDMKEEQFHLDGRKMTDEEKRKNFLERNRVAALKCRQRKKQWLQNLQAKVELFSSENDSLSAQVHGLREEIVGLKTLLLQHKDCPISQSQGVGGSYFQQQPQSGYDTSANPYGIGITNGHQNMANQRR